MNYCKINLTESQGLLCCFGTSKEKLLMLFVHLHQASFKNYSTVQTKEFWREELPLKGPFELFNWVHIMNMQDTANVRSYQQQIPRYIQHTFNELYYFRLYTFHGEKPEVDTWSIVSTQTQLISTCVCVCIHLCCYNHCVILTSSSEVSTILQMLSKT